MIQGHISIHNAKIITPKGVVEGGLWIEDGRIARIIPGEHQETTVYGDSLDANGCYVMPGMIDMHSDALEKEIQPRPNTFFPLHMSFYELEKKLAGCGVTTIYHSLSLADGVGVRDDNMVIDVIEHIIKLREERAMINHRVHLRYEVTNLPGIDTVRNLIDNRKIDLLSLMDHTPGQGQFTEKESYENYLVKTYGVRDEELRIMINKLKSDAKIINWERIRDIAQHAIGQGIVVASHDDDTEAKIDQMIDYGVTISEFPINRTAAEYSYGHNLLVCVGSPNLVRGQSHSNNMRAVDAVKEGFAHAICSDYLPSSMLPAVFMLHEVENMPLHLAVAMVTSNLAAALGISDQVGSIEAGKLANLLFVNLHNGYPLVQRTMVNGETIYYAKPFHSQSSEQVYA
ncbi:alpha-D-ribose 1-methylphosphonate 5-triphosphate diphosphatase [Cohnella sp.]|uniref:alpha-D-ribose 1-methylphosphonate 5-triphosphate diphosphatase n=1 Tax=Cohnella sp. TaxID=1883426 RepID=UPI003568791C